jgi:poly(A) polymerase
MTEALLSDPADDPSAAYPRIYSRGEHGISRKNISQNALKVLYRLHEHGYRALLVGGGVRDLLLGREPKDFDVATDATPEEVRDIFRNCRLIGRRFRLAHVHFKGDIIEVATFRGSGDTPAEGQEADGDGRIVRDNCYGTLEEDAFRRDFTVNALYYDIADFSVVDYVGGVEDLRAGRVRLIGDPETRYTEDPVRMLRAVRFAAGLGFFIDMASAAPIPGMSGMLESIPPARLFEECNKLFLSGESVTIYQMLRRFRLFEQLFPATAEILHEEANHYPHTFLTHVFADTDQRVADERPVTPAFVLAALLWHPVHRRWGELVAEEGEESPEEAVQRAGGQVLRDQVQHVSVPKRFTEPMREIWHIQARMERARGKRALRLLGHPRFRAAYDFLLLRARSGEADEALADWWTQLLEADTDERSRITGAQSSGRRRGGRKRSRRSANKGSEQPA